MMRNADDIDRNHARLLNPNCNRRRITGQATVEGTTERMPLFLVRVQL